MDNSNFFFYSLTKSINYKLPVSSHYSRESFAADENTTRLDEKTLKLTSSRLTKFQTHTLPTNFVQRLSIINNDILGLTNNSSDFFFYPLTVHTGMEKKYCCAYCLTDVTKPRDHILSCLTKFNTYRDALDCVCCNHIATTELQYYHFFDQNHSTVINTGLIYDAQASTYSRVDMRMELKGSYYTPATKYFLLRTLLLNMYGPIAALQIVTKHSLEDMCHTASYLQTLDAEVRNRPIKNGKYQTSCSCNTAQYRQELPISPNLMFLILDRQVASCIPCKNPAHKENAVNCPGFAIVICDIPEGQIFNPFFLILRRRLTNGAMDITTYYRTTADPDDHYKYDTENMTKRIGLYRYSAKYETAETQQDFSFEDLMNCALVPDNSDPYYVFFADPLEWICYWHKADDKQPTDPFQDVIFNSACVEIFPENLAPSPIGNKNKSKRSKTTVLKKKKNLRNSDSPPCSGEILIANTENDTSRVDVFKNVSSKKNNIRAPIRYQERIDHHKKCSGKIFCGNKNMENINPDFFYDQILEKNFFKHFDIPIKDPDELLLHHQNLMNHELNIHLLQDKTPLTAAKTPLSFYQEVVPFKKKS